MQRKVTLSKERCGQRTGWVIWRRILLLHQEEAVIDIRRAITDAKDLWYTIRLLLHRFLVGVAVNHGGQGGTAFDPLVWDQRCRFKLRRVETRVHEDLASLPGSRFLEWALDSG